jgi:hypothetical protein
VSAQRFFWSISYFFQRVQPAMCNSWQLSSPVLSTRRCGEEN